MKTDKAIFAAGCFWGVQFYFDEVPGVIKTTVGYTGGNTKNPTYESIHYQETNHAEAVLIEFDPKRVSYHTLLQHLFRIHDPTLLNSDGINVGTSYRSAIFYLSDEQKQQAEAYIRQLAEQEQFKKPIVTEVTKASEFYPAEEYHQKFTQKTGIGACHVEYKPV